jgi:hypothetical protein
MKRENKHPPMLNPNQFSTEEDFVDATLLGIEKHIMNNPEYKPRSLQRELAYAKKVYKDKDYFNSN